MKISDQQRELFDARGVLRLDGLLPDRALAPARELMLETLEELGVCRAGTWVADRTPGYPPSSVFKRLKAAAKRSAAFDGLLTPEVHDAVSQLVDGRAARAVPDRPQLLFTHPNAETWTVPHKVWHLDVPRLGDFGLPGVQMFAFLHPVTPGGGGTLVVAGSHLLLNDRGRIRSKDVKGRLKNEAYFRELFGSGEDRLHFLDTPGRVGDVELQVVEMCGEPGDVYLTDLRLLHTLAPNVTDVPRLMATQRFFLDDALAAIGVLSDAA